MNRKVVITCAVTGSIHTPTMSPYLPITPAQIAGQAIDAAKAGAAILHLHARDPIDGRPTPRAAVFREFLEPIHAECDAVINISTGGAHTMALEERLEAALAFEPEMASCNVGSLNFGFFPILDKIKEWKHDWEPKYLEASRNAIFRNTFGDIEQLFERLAKPLGTRFEFECYDVGHLYTLKHFVDRGYAVQPFAQFVLGILGGIGADPENLLHMKRIADKLFGADGYRFGVLGAGRHQMPLITQSALLGGHVRVGLEDSLTVAPGRLATSNAEQVALIREVLERLGFEIATPDEARQMLALKGKHRVKL